MLLIHYEYYSALLFSSAWPVPYFHSIYDSTYSSSNSSSNTVFVICSFHKINTHTCAAFVGLLQKKTVIRVFRMAQFNTVSIMYLSSYNGTVLYGIMFI